MEHTPSYVHARPQSLARTLSTLHDEIQLHRHPLPSTLCVTAIHTVTHALLAILAILYTELLLDTVVAQKSGNSLINSERRSK